MSARWRLAATGLTSPKAGVPRTTSSFTAAVVSSWARWTSSRSVMGRRARARSFPSSVTAQAASISSTRGSSRVWMDFSNSSLMVGFSTSSGLSAAIIPFRGPRVNERAPGDCAAGQNHL